MCRGFLNCTLWKSPSVKARETYAADLKVDFDLRKLSNQDLQPILIWENLVQLQMFQPTKRSTWNPVAVGSILESTLVHFSCWRIQFMNYLTWNIAWCWPFSVCCRTFLIGNFAFKQKEKQKPQLLSHYKNWSLFLD